MAHSDRKYLKMYEDRRNWGKFDGWGHIAMGVQDFFAYMGVEEKQANVMSGRGKTGRTPAAKRAYIWVVTKKGSGLDSQAAAACEAARDAWYIHEWRKEIMRDFCGKEWKSGIRELEGLPDDCVGYGVFAVKAKSLRGLRAGMAKALAIGVNPALFDRQRFGPGGVHYVTFEAHQSAIRPLIGPDAGDGWNVWTGPGWPASGGGETD